MKILLASDHGGFNLKSHLYNYLTTLGVFEVEDFGPLSLNPNDDYPDYVLPLAKHLQLNTHNQRGVVICRNGVGVCMATNKFKGIRAALATSVEQAVTSRTDDNSNVLCLPADFLKNDLALQILNAWLGTEFSYENRHLRRLTKLSLYGSGYSSETIFPSIFEEHMDEINKKISKAQKIFEIIQIDFADGKLVDGRTYLDMYELGLIKSSSKFEMHLMLDNPLIALDKKIQNVVKVCSQIETKHTKDFINKSKSLGYLTGLSLNVQSSVESLEPYIDDLDYVQFMTVEAGGKGRSFEPSVLNKISSFKKRYPKIPVQVDGHVNIDTINKIIKSGADFVAPNSALFEGDLENNFIKLLNEIEK